MAVPATAHTLRAEGSDASEDGTGRGTPIIPAVAGCLQERDAKGVDSDTKPGHLVPISFDMAHGDDPARTGDKTNTLQSRMGTGGNQVPCVAFERRFVRTTGGQPNDSGVHPCLKAGVNNGDGAPCVAFAQNTRDEVREMKIAGALASQPGMKQTTYLRQDMAVRRLTPTECERLQGFPDGYTAGFSDSVRYRMLGNAVCVNVAEWIAKRLAKAMIMGMNGGHSDK